MNLADEKSILGEERDCPFPGAASELDALVIIKPAQLFAKTQIETLAAKIFRRASVVCPDSLGQLEKTAERASKSFGIVVVGGGDGTLNRVIQRLDFSEIGVAVAALGSGNDFARNFKSGGTTAAKIGAFRTANWQRVDLIKAGSYLFHNSGGVGLDAATLITRESAKSKFGRDYNVAFLRTLAKLKPFDAEVEVGGERLDGKFLWALAMNNRWIGGGMLAAPSAKIDDGLLDALLVRDMSKIKLALMFPSVYKGTHIHNPSAKYVQSGTMTIRFDKPPKKIALDGELYSWDAAELTFEIAPKAMWVFGDRIAK